MILSAATPSSRKRVGASSRGRGGLSGRPETHGKLAWADRGGDYLHFTLYKENKDTMEVISYLCRQLKVNAKAFQFAGTKDKRGVTVQRVSGWRIEADRVAQQNKCLRSAAVGDFQYLKQGLELGDLKGNQFLITLRDCKWQYQQNLSLNEKVVEAKKELGTALSNLREKGYFNYYGLQRFGTFGTRTDSIGVKILQGDLQSAVDMILAYNPEALSATQDPTSTSQVSSENKARAEAIQIFRTTGKANDALNKMPRKFSAETAIIRHLARARNDFGGALQNIQRNLRLMYAHAYQSLVWNFAVGERWRLYGDKVVKGDLVMVNEHNGSENGIKEDAGGVDADGEVIIQPEGEDRAPKIDDVFERARALTTEEAENGDYSIFDVVLPLPGYDILYPNNGMADWYKSFMASEKGGGLDPHDMRRKQKDYSLSGSYRKILSRIEPGASSEVRTYKEDDEQFVETDLDVVEQKKRVTMKTEPEEGDKIAVVLKFQLGSSQYATMVLRELMKGGTLEHKPDFGAGR